MRLLRSGEFETLKAVVHAVGLVVAGVCFVYNFAAFLKRRERHLARNAIVYGLAIEFERRNVLHHRRKTWSNPAEN